jgi:hypothetical protein
MIKKMGLILSLIIFISCHDKNRFKKIRDNSIGEYYLDLSKSDIKLNSNDSSYFKNLTFKLTKDSFEFSRKLPYEYDSVGTWALEEIDVNIIYINLFFRTRGVWQIGPGGNFIEMPYWLTIEKYPAETGNLHFVKINH